MYLITGITSDPTQSQTLVLPDGTQASLTISYYPQQYAWFILELVYEPANFTLQGMQLATNPNLLNQWKNSLPFGLGCFVVDNREATQLQDFESGAAQLYILSDAEVAAYYSFLTTGVTVS